MRTPRLRGATLTPVLVVGCGQVLGLDGDSVVRGKNDASTENPAGTKDCAGKQVRLDDPQFGCAATACEPCSIPFASDVKCVAGACTPVSCRPGRADCNGKPEDGCETDLSAPETCGSCSVQCTTEPLCATIDGIARCVSTCPAGQSQCGRTCVDLATSATNCGQCGRVCDGSATADPVCVDSKCGVSCRAGTKPCDGSNPANGCGNAIIFYRDADNDRHGTSSAPMTSCVQPPGFVVSNDDCEDSNPEVFKGQTKYFPTAYARASGGSSYDYNCDGAEEEAPGFVHFPGCSGACNESGYAPSPATPPGIMNAYCGSTTQTVCVSTSSSGIDAAPPPGLAFCASTTKTGQPAISCR
jgi:hypothetical protein